MPWNKKENSLGVGKGSLWMWFRKVQLKNPPGAAVTVNITKAELGEGVKKTWNRVGTIFLDREDVQQLFYELQHLLNTWDEKK